MLVQHIHGKLLASAVLVYIYLANSK